MEDNQTSEYREIEIQKQSFFETLQEICQNVRAMKMMVEAIRFEVSELRDRCLADESGSETSEQQDFSE